MLEIINAIYVSDKPGKAFKSLDKNNATQKVCREALGYGATTQFCEIPAKKLEQGKGRMMQSLL